MDKLSEFEKADLSDTLYFFLDFDDNCQFDYKKAISHVEVIYDGVSQLNFSEIDRGMIFKNGEIRGFPSPVLCFSFLEPVNQHDFLKCVWRSSVKFGPSYLNLNNEEPFYFEDHQGYTSVIGKPDLNGLREATVQSGHTFKKSISPKILIDGVRISQLRGN